MLILIASGQGLRGHTCTVHVDLSNEAPLLDFINSSALLVSPTCLSLPSPGSEEQKKKKRLQKPMLSRCSWKRGWMRPFHLPATFVFDVSLPCSQPFNFRLDRNHSLPISAPACVAISKKKK